MFAVVFTSDHDCPDVIKNDCVYLEASEEAATALAIKLLETLYPEDTNEIRKQLAEPDLEVDLLLSEYQEQLLGMMDYCHVNPVGDTAQLRAALA